MQRALGTRDLILVREVSSTISLASSPHGIVCFMGISNNNTFSPDCSEGTIIHYYKMKQIDSKISGQKIACVSGGMECPP